MDNIYIAFLNKFVSHNSFHGNTINILLKQSGCYNLLRHYVPSKMINDQTSKRIG